MSFTQADIQTAMANVGKPTAGEVTDANKTMFSRNALISFNRKVPNIVLRTIETVADQQEYAVNAATNSVLQVWPDAPTESIFKQALNVVGIGGGEFVKLAADVGLSGWDQVSSYLQAKAQLQVWQKMERTSWKFIGGLIYLTPTPSAAGDLIPYLSKEEFTWTTVGAVDRFRSALEYLYAEEQLLYLATQRTGQGGVSPTTGAFIEFPYDKLKALAKDYREKADMALKGFEVELRLNIM